MSLKANPRSRGKRPTSNRLAVERIIRDAETMVLVDASEWAEVNDQEVTFADAAE